MLTVTLRYTRRLGMVTRASQEYCSPQKPTSTNRSVPIHVRPKPCPFQSTSVPIHVRLIHIRPNPCPSQSLSVPYSQILSVSIKSFRFQHLVHDGTYFCFPEQNLFLNLRQPLLKIVLGFCHLLATHRPYVHH